MRFFERRYIFIIFFGNEDFEVKLTIKLNERLTKNWKASHFSYDCRIHDRSYMKVSKS